MSDPKTVVAKLKKLASAPENRSYVANDKTCMKALVNFLSNSDADVVSSTLDTLLFLSLDNANGVLLARQPGLVPQVKKYMLEHMVAATTKRTASDIYANLQDFLDQVPAFQPEAHQSEAVTESISSSRHAQNTNNSTNDDISASMAFFSQKNRETKTSVASTFNVLLPILENEVGRKLVEEILLSTKGVVSFVLDSNKKQACVRYHKSAAELVKDLTNRGLKATLIGDESKENLPDYLPENDAQNKGWFGSLVLWGSTPKKTPQANRKPPASQQNGWFGSISDTLKLF